jgi:CPA2 family monovalent cation:H+ antiporter-2
MQPLLALGANEVVPEEFETALEIFSRTLRKLLVPRDTVERFVREARVDGYGLLTAGGASAESEDLERRLPAGAELEVLRVEAGSSLAGRSLLESNLRRESGATILAVKEGDEFSCNPPGSVRLEAGTIAIVFGTPEQVAAAAGLFRAPDAPSAR